MVEGLNMIKRHTKKNQANPQGRIVEREGTIHISNLMLAEKYDARVAARRRRAENRRRTAPAARPKPRASHETKTLREIYERGAARLAGKAEVHKTSTRFRAWRKSWSTWASAPRWKRGRWRTPCGTWRMITGRKPVISKSRHSIANFKLREGQAIGCRVTLRREEMYEFFDRLVATALPRIRDFRGLSPRSFDGRGNYTLGVAEQTIFPEIELDKIKRTRAWTSR